MNLYKLNSCIVHGTYSTKVSYRYSNMVLRRIFGPRRDEVTGGMEEIA